VNRTGLAAELRRFWNVLQRHRFAMLLVSLAALFAATALVFTFEAYGNRLLAGIVVACLFDLVLLSAVNVVCDTRRTMAVAISFAVPAIVCNLLHVITRSTVVAVTSNLLSLCFISIVVVLVLAFLLRHEQIDANMICASLCVYLMIGMIWSLLFSLCAVLHPDSFVYAYTDLLERPEMAFGAESSLNPIYYSFVTLTTLGYGDIVPFSPPAKMLAVLEAIVGQIYLTVLVARLVGLHIAHGSSGSRPKNSDAQD